MVDFFSFLSLKSTAELDFHQDFVSLNLFHNSLTYFISKHFKNKVKSIDLGKVCAKMLFISKFRQF